MYGEVGVALLCDRGMLIWSHRQNRIENADDFLGLPPWEYALQPDEMRRQLADCLATGWAEGLNLTQFPDDVVRLWRACWKRVDSISGVRALIKYRELPVELNHLTPRQLDVLRAVVECDTLTVICFRLGITPRTYHSHVANIRATLRRNDLWRVAEWLYGVL